MINPTKANIAWPAGVVLFIFLILLENNRVFILALIGAVATQIWTWYRHPQVNLTINSVDYISRIATYVAVLACVYFVNKVYISKLNIFKRQYKLQEIISKVSSAFVYSKLNEAELAEKVSFLLKNLGEFFDVDRVYIFLFSEDLKYTRYSFEWSRDKVEDMIDQVEDIPTESIPWGMSKLLAGQVLNIERVEDLPPEASTEKLILEEQNIKSLLSVPMAKGSDIVGFVGFDSVNRYREWNQAEINTLKIVAQLLSDAIIIVRSDIEIKKNLVELEKHANYDKLTGLPNRRLFFEQLDRIIAEGERYGESFALLFIDLDGFKSVNDNYGHEVGDEVLILVGNRLVSNVRRSDIVS